MRKNNEGMPNYENIHKRGALYITFDVDFPKKTLSDEEKESKWFINIFFFFSVLFLINVIKKTTSLLT